jgi:hypothetical protein
MGVFLFLQARYWEFHKPNQNRNPGAENNAWGFILHGNTGQNGIGLDKE